MALGVMMLSLYCCTLQLHVNGSRSPYATDVGEIQNALPRWGTLHFTGYPQYSLIGSVLVTILHWVGVPPAPAASLFSALWGGLVVALTFEVARELGARRLPSAGAAIVFGLALSFWVDASLAEVHTMTMAFTAGSMLAGLRFARTGSKRDLLWLAFLCAQGVVHQRAVVFIAPAVLVLVWGRWRTVWKNAWSIVGHAVCALATYLYLPIRAWTGAQWTFNAPGTWRGFWGLVFDTKAGRIVRLPADAAEFWGRLRTVAALLSQDLPWLALGLGIAGLVILVRRGRLQAAVSLTMLIVVHLGVTTVIWEGRTSDALLAVKLPAIWACAVGLAFIAPAGHARWPQGAWAAAALSLVVYLGAYHAPQVLAITRDRSSEGVIQRVSALPLTDEPTTIWMPWGHDYWALRYAQTYRGELQGLTIADHNASIESIIASGQRLVTAQETFYVFPTSWFEERLGRVYLSSPSFGLVEIRTAPMQGVLTPGATLLGNGVAAASATVARQGEGQLAVTVQWLVVDIPGADYAVGVHLVEQTPTGAEPNVLAQADSQHPVYGWYPTSRWSSGELVTEHYLLTVPLGSHPTQVRLFMYTHDDTGFHNTNAVVLEAP